MLPVEWRNYFYNNKLAFVTLGVDAGIPITVGQTPKIPRPIKNLC